MSKPPLRYCLGQSLAPETYARAGFYNLFNDHHSFEPTPQGLTPLCFFRNSDILICLPASCHIIKPLSLAWDSHLASSISRTARHHHVVMHVVLQGCAWARRLREQGAFRVHGHSQMWLMPLTGGAVASYWLSKQILFNVYNIQKTKKTRTYRRQERRYSWEYDTLRELSSCRCTVMMLSCEWIWTNAVS